MDAKSALDVVMDAEEVSFLLESGAAVVVVVKAGGNVMTTSLFSTPNWKEPMLLSQSFLSDNTTMASKS